MLSSVRMPITPEGDARQVLAALRDHLDHQETAHLINAALPKISAERKPEDALDHNVMGHVKRRALLLQKRRAPEGRRWTIEFMALEKSLYVHMPDDSRPRWLYTRVYGYEEWGDVALGLIKCDKEELTRGGPEV